MSAASPSELNFGVVSGSPPQARRAWITTRQPSACNARIKVPRPYLSFVLPVMVWSRMTTGRAADVLGAGWDEVVVGLVAAVAGEGRVEVAAAAAAAAEGGVAALEFVVLVVESVLAVVLVVEVVSIILALS